MMRLQRQEWICCQLGAREHYSVARALARQSALAALCTDLWVRPEDVLGGFQRRTRTRYEAELDHVNVIANNWGSVAFELKARISRRRGWELMIARNGWFQTWVVEALRSGSLLQQKSIVMAYSYAARDILAYAKKRGCLTVLAQIDPGPPEERIVSRLHADAGQTQHFQPPPRQYWADWREECALADRIVVNSDWTREALINEGISSAKLRLIPLAYENSVPSVRRQYPVKFSRTRPLRVLFLGQINLRKGVGPLLEAIRDLAAYPIEFWFVGPIHMQVPAQFSHARNTRWFGPVSRSDTYRFYRDADLMIFPTFSDGFGLTQLEAQAWSLPIITTPFCGGVVKDGHNGVLLQDNTSTEIKRHLQTVVGCPALLQNLSDNSSVSVRFGLSAIGHQWLTVFD